MLNILHLLNFQDDDHAVAIARDVGMSLAMFTYYVRIKDKHFRIRSDNNNGLFTFNLYDLPTGCLIK